MFHFGSFGCKKQIPSSYLKNRGVLLGQLCSVIRTGKLSGPAAALITRLSLCSLSLILSLILSNYFFNSPFSPLASLFTLFIFSAQVEVWFIHGLSSVFQGVFSSSSPLPSQFPSFIIYNASEQSDWPNMSFHPRSHRSVVIGHILDLLCLPENKT